MVLLMSNPDFWFTLGLLMIGVPSSKQTWRAGKSARKQRSFQAITLHIQFLDVLGFPSQPCLLTGGYNKSYSPSWLTPKIYHDMKIHHSTISTMSASMNSPSLETANVVFHVVKRGSRARSHRFCTLVFSFERRWWSRWWHVGSLQTGRRTMFRNRGRTF